MKVKSIRPNISPPPVLKQGVLRQRKHNQNLFLSKLNISNILRELNCRSTNRGNQNPNSLHYVRIFHFHI